jgi:hypothetical protein
MQMYLHEVICKRIIDENSRILIRIRIRIRIRTKISWIRNTAGHGPNNYEDTKPKMSAFLTNGPVKEFGGRCLCV